MHYRSKQFSSKPSGTSPWIVFRLPACGGPSLPSHKSFFIGIWVGQHGLEVLLLKWELKTCTNKKWWNLAKEWKAMMRSVSSSWGISAWVLTPTGNPHKYLSKVHVSHIKLDPGFFFANGKDVIIPTNSPFLLQTLNFPLLIFLRIPLPHKKHFLWRSVDCSRWELDLNNNVY